jgi:hypothetical protein
MSLVSIQKLVSVRKGSFSALGRWYAPRGGTGVYASAQPLDYLARMKIFRLKPVRGMTRLSLLFESETASPLSGVSGWTLPITEDHAAGAIITLNSIENPFKSPFRKRDFDCPCQIFSFASPVSGWMPVSAPNSSYIF